MFQIVSGFSHLKTGTFSASHPPRPFFFFFFERRQHFGFFLLLYIATTFKTGIYTKRKEFAPEEQILSFSADPYCQLTQKHFKRVACLSCVSNPLNKKRYLVKRDAKMSPKMTRPFSPENKNVSYFIFNVFIVQMCFDDF